MPGSASRADRRRLWSSRAYPAVTVSSPRHQPGLGRDIVQELAQAQVVAVGLLDHELAAVMRHGMERSRPVELE